MFMKPNIASATRRPCSPGKDRFSLTFLSGPTGPAAHWSHCCYAEKQITWQLFLFYHQLIFWSIFGKMPLRNSWTGVDRLPSPPQRCFVQAMENIQAGCRVVVFLIAFAAENSIRTSGRTWDFNWTHVVHCCTTRMHKSAVDEGGCARSERGHCPRES